MGDKGRLIVIAINVIQGLGAEKIKGLITSIGKDDTPEGEAARAALQGILACTTAAGKGADCGSAALGASGSVALNYLANSIGKDSKDLTPQEKEDRLNLINTILTGTVDALGGDAAAASAAAKIEYENNTAASAAQKVVDVCKSNPALCATLGKEALELLGISGEMIAQTPDLGLITNSPWAGVQANPNGSAFEQAFESLKNRSEMYDMPASMYIEVINANGETSHVFLMYNASTNDGVFTIDGKAYSNLGALAQAGWVAKADAIKVGAANEQGKLINAGALSQIVGGIIAPEPAEPQPPFILPGYPAPEEKSPDEYTHVTPVPNPEDIPTGLPGYGEGPKPEMPNHTGGAPIDPPQKGDNVITQEDNAYGLGRPFRPVNPEFPPIDAAEKALASSQIQEMAQNIRWVDCSEIAEEIQIAAGGAGKIIEIRPTKEGRLIINRFGKPSNPEYYYHQVYTDGKYVYDPLVSSRPIPYGDWELQMQRMNPSGVTINDKLKGIQ